MADQPIPEDEDPDREAERAENEGDQEGEGEGSGSLFSKINPKGLISLALDVWEHGDRRKILVGSGFTVLALGAVIAWVTLAGIAAKPDPVTIDLVLRALDEGEDSLARAMVSQMQEQTDLTVGEYGGPLFVLGALKAREAEQQWSAERRRAEFFIASRYLNEARVIGLPEGREAEGLLLLGKSLLESRQLRTGIEVLQEALQSGARGGARVHELLAEAYFYSPNPRYTDSIKHVDLAIENPESTRALRDNVNHLKAEAHSALGQGDEALEAAQAIVDPPDPVRHELLLGKAWMAKFLTALSEATDATAIKESGAKAVEHFQKAREIDQLSSEYSKQSTFLEARVQELSGDIRDSLQLYAQLRRDYGSTPTGIAAALAEADRLVVLEEYSDALDSYRHALDAVEEPAIYRSDLISLKEIRSRIENALNELLHVKQFRQAISLADHLTPLFTRKKQLELSAKVYELWGKSLLDAAEATPLSRVALEREGRNKFRKAGVARQELAELRFATKEFTDDLWRASEAYYRGQSYSSSIAVLERYLLHEPEQRNALALLRLGQSYLSQGKPNQAINSLLECLEFNSSDASSYQARLYCAKAYRLIGDVDRAEEMLLDNLLRTAMTPASPEWRDSLFELGRLQSEASRYLDAIQTFDEAVQRYPDDSQIRQARYLIGESHRLAASGPLSNLAKAKTVNERERYREQARGHLEQALKSYQIVQNEITLLEAPDEPDRLMLRNCYMMRGTVLFELGRFEDAIKAYSSVSTLYQNEPFVLETLVQISHCWRRLNDVIKARGAIQQARLLLARLPENADFASSTNLNRGDWERLLTNLSQF